MKKYEYKVLPISIQSSNEDIEKTINEAGAQGWDLISTGQAGLKLNHYFKREVHGKPGPKQK